MVWGTGKSEDIRKSSGWYTGWFNSYDSYNDVTWMNVFYDIASFEKTNKNDMLMALSK